MDDFFNDDKNQNDLDENGSKDWDNSDLDQNSQQLFKANEPSEPNQTNQTNQPNQNNQTSKTNQTNQTSQTNSQNYYGQNKNTYPYNNNAYPYNNSSYPYNSSQNQNIPTPPPQKKTGKKLLSAIIAIAILFAGTGIGYSLRNHGNINTPTETTQDEQKGIDNGPNIEFNQTPQNEPTVSDSGELMPGEVYKKIKDSSVGLLVYSEKSQNLYTEGSGIIMGEDTDHEYTYIVTCAHVISEANISVRVQMHDSTEYDAQIIGYDERTDTGVVRIKANGLKAAEFGDSDLVEVGQTVYAIGNPGGIEFAGSFTAGMVSALDRPISSSQSRYTMECIQHQAAINPGNSGGALVNAYGQVIGINSAKLVAGYEGMGFAVPSKVFKTVVEQIIKHGYVPNRPKLGITYAPASAFRAYFVVLKIKDLPPGSIVIQGISNDSSILNTKIQINDMIVAVNGKDLTTSDQLPALIENSKVGDKLKLKIVRVSQDYSISEFEETITLIEDKGNVGYIEDTEDPTNTTPDPFEDFSFPFDLP